MVDILHRVGIDTRPDRVFEALTTIKGIQDWWIGTASGSAARGDSFTFGPNEMLVLDAEPAKLVRWRCTRGPEEWLNTEVSFRLAWKQDQTFVLFKHADWREPVEFMHHCSTRWAIFLLSLRDLIEKGNGRPTPNDIKSYVNE